METALILPILVIMLRDRSPALLHDDRHAQRRPRGDDAGGTKPDSTCAELKATVDREMGRTGADAAVCGPLGTTTNIAYITMNTCERADPARMLPFNPSYPPTRTSGTPVRIEMRFQPVVPLVGFLTGNGIGGSVPLAAENRSRSSSGTRASRHEPPITDERGQALVEFALVIPIVLLLMRGLFDLGRVVFINNSLSDGASQGARHASVGPRDADYCTRVDDAVRSATRGQPLTPTPSNTSARSRWRPQRRAARPVPERRQRARPGRHPRRAARPGDRVTVEVGTNVDLILGFIARATGQSSFALHAESTMQVTFAP